MVNPDPERKADADYSLGRVAELACWQCVRYAGTRVTLDVDALDYALDDVCACLLELRAGDFSHSERYCADGPWHDVYKPCWAPSGRRPDDIYVKFRMDSGLLVIELCSFHQPR